MGCSLGLGLARSMAEPPGGGKTAWVNAASRGGNGPRGVSATAGVRTKSGVFRPFWTTRFGVPAGARGPILYETLEVSSELDGLPGGDRAAVK